MVLYVARGPNYKVLCINMLYGNRWMCTIFGVQEVGKIMGNGNVETQKPTSVGSAT